MLESNELETKIDESTRSDDIIKHIPNTTRNNITCYLDKIIFT